MFYARLEIEGAHLNLFFQWGKTDHDFLLAWHPIQALHVLQFHRGIAAKGHFQLLIILHSHHVHWTLWKARVTKRGDRLKSLLLQILVQDAADGLFDHHIGQVAFRNPAKGFQNPLFDFLCQGTLLYFSFSYGRFPQIHLTRFMQVSLPTKSTTYTLRLWKPSILS
jgi:hypothetical protein